MSSRRDSLQIGAIAGDMPLLFGANPDPGLVAVEHVETRGAPDHVELFIRDGDTLRRQPDAFEPFLVAAAGLLDACPIAHERDALDGRGPLKVRARFTTWKDAAKARDWLAKSSGASRNTPEAPYLFVSDPVQQYLMQSGRTLFKGMPFESLRRMQVDIECRTTPGFEFCNAEREGDSIFAIGIGTPDGTIETLSANDMDEKTLLERFVQRVKELDPDVIEGHNIFNFDLPYLAERARRFKVPFSLGRDGSKPSVRPSRFSAGERTLTYERFDVYGRHVVDTLFLVHLYDISHRSLDGFGLKDVAIHFGLASDTRTYIEGAEIAATFDRDPKKALAYLRDDLTETRALSALLSRSSFVQAQVLPYSYQNTCVRGNATKIDALMQREYLRLGHALPLPDAARDFEGGYTDMFKQGVIANVHHVDVRSLYPSLMLTRRLGPSNDDLGIFLKLLDTLRDFRLKAKEAAKTSPAAADRTYYDALQTTFKILINSFYGYLGFSQARFSDFQAAEQVTAQGRELLSSMIRWMKAHDAEPVEIDTDGIYFVPPPGAAGETLAKFRASFARTLPPGIEVEFDGEYASMYSYKMKNYALLSADGQMTIKGAALKSRGLEPFQREFLRELIRRRLEGRDAELPALKAKYEAAITNHEWPIERLAKTETLQDAPATYAAKLTRDQRSRSAAYELALKSGRDYRAGDQLTYYVTGAKKTVTVFESARLVSEWKPDQRDENVPYYLAKLAALYEKFAQEGPQQQELAL